MPMSPRLLRPRASNANVASDTDARAYIEAVRLADGQYMEPAVQLAVNAFVVGCKADGIWSAIKASCLLMGARTLSGALTPLVGAAPTNNFFVSSDYNRRTGLIGNGTTKYLNTNLTGYAGLLESNHQSVYVTALKTNSAVTGYYIGHGTADDGGDGGQFSWHLGHGSGTPGNIASRNKHSGSFLSNVVNAGGSTGFIGQARSGSGVGGVSVRAAGANTAFDTVAQANDTRPLLVFARGYQGAPSLPSDARLSFYSAGDNLNLALLDSRVSTLYTAIGAAIP